MNNLKQQLFKIFILTAILTFLFTACSKENRQADNLQSPTFLKSGKTYIVGIPKHTPRDENTPISKFSMTVLEHGGGSWYRIAFRSYETSTPPKTIETWFNLDSATFISEGEDLPTKVVFPLF